MSQQAEVLTPPREAEKGMTTRGLVVLETDLYSLRKWPSIIKQHGLTTLGVGPGSIRKYLAEFLETEDGKMFLAECSALGVEVEYETHALGELLPRELFSGNPALFRMNEAGERVSDYNCCPSNPLAVEIVCENAVEFARRLASTTRRYFFWIDDARAMCRCEKCRAYSDSDQALMLENAMVRALHTLDPRITLAHLAYSNTLAAPTHVKPEAGIFLEFAPIHRSYTEPLTCSSAHQEGQAITHGEVLEKLDANLAVFGSSTAHVLEYWLDVSRFSNWKQPAVRLPWNKDVFLDDVRTYTSRGIRSITSYAAWVDSDYVTAYGMPPLDEYSCGLTAAAHAPGR